MTEIREDLMNQGSLKTDLSDFDNFSSSAIAQKNEFYNKESIFPIISYLWGNQAVLSEVYSVDINLTIVLMMADPLGSVIRSVLGEEILSSSTLSSSSLISWKLFKLQTLSMDMLPNLPSRALLSDECHI